MRRPYVYHVARPSSAPLCASSAEAGVVRITSRQELLYAAARKGKRGALPRPGGYTLDTLLCAFRPSVVAPKRRMMMPNASNPRSPRQWPTFYLVLGSLSIPKDADSHSRPCRGRPATDTSSQPRLAGQRWPIYLHPIPTFSPAGLEPGSSCVKHGAGRRARTRVSLESDAPETVS